MINDRMSMLREDVKQTQARGQGRVRQNKRTGSGRSRLRVKGASLSAPIPAVLPARPRKPNLATHPIRIQRDDYQGLGSMARMVRRLRFETLDPAAFDPGVWCMDQNEDQFYSHRLPIIKVIQQRRASGKASSMWEAAAQQEINVEV
jgi:hypothetical protein